MPALTKDASTKDRLFDAAQALILAKGFVGTTVDDVCKAAKVTKGSFFHYFKSKDDLARQLLERYCLENALCFSGACCEKTADPLERVYGFLDTVIDVLKKKAGSGCLVGSMAQELSETHPEIRSICGRAFGEMARVLERELKEAKTKHAPKNAAIKPDSLARHFVVVLEGTLLVTKVRSGETASPEEGLKHYKDYLKALFER